MYIFVSYTLNSFYLVLVLVQVQVQVPDTLDTFAGTRILAYSSNGNVK